MNKLNRKTSVILMIISFAIWQILTKFFPLKFKAIDYSLTLLFAFSFVLFVIAVLKESEALSVAAYIWSSFGLPLFAVQLLGIDYLTQFVPIENFVWVLLAYLLAIPFIVSGLAVYLILVCKTATQVYMRAQ